MRAWKTNNKTSRRAKCLAAFKACEDEEIVLRKQHLLRKQTVFFISRAKFFFLDTEMLRVLATENELQINI